MRELLKRLLHFLLGEYQYWKVFALDLPQSSVPWPSGFSVRELDPANPPDTADAEVLSRMEYGGEGSVGYGLFKDAELVAVQWYWWGARYEQERQGRSWRLPVGAAKSVGLYTAPAHRGRGYATLLKQSTAPIMAGRGFARLYSRIWHSHAGSIRVSEKLGWRLVGAYIEISPFSKPIGFRVKRPFSRE